MYVDVNYNPSTFDTEYFVENLTTDKYWASPQESTSNWTGESADFEFEMPAVDTLWPKYPTVPFTDCLENQVRGLTTVVAADSTETEITAGGAYAYPGALGTSANDGFTEIFVRSS